VTDKSFRACSSTPSGTYSKRERTPAWG
jgi:hypothetical protein